MGSAFLVYLQLGFEHIADIRGYDHILFIAALTVAYPLSAWRRLLILVTAFTLGHSLTLALATIGAIRVNTDLVEVLIPATIVIASVSNIVDSRTARDAASRAARDRRHHLVLYALAGIFGLVHGLGFSSFLRAVLGQEESIIVPLLAFNAGLEVGQIAIVLVLFALGGLMTHVVRLHQRAWVLAVSGTAAGFALILMVDRIPR